jgi:hypothetical protein
MASKNVKISKKELAEKTQAAKDNALTQSVNAEEHLSEGARKVQTAKELADLGMMETAAGASDLTRAEDAVVVAERVKTLSDVVGVAGIVDVAEGAEMLAASEDVSVMSAMVGLMGEEDLETGLELARIAGELWAVSDVVDMLQMPALTEFLAERGEILQEMAVEQILRSASTKGVARAIEAAGGTIADLGNNEIAEGVTRMAVSEGLAEGSKQLKKAGVKLGKQGVKKVEKGEMITRDARVYAKEGIGDMVGGGAEMGSAAATEDIANRLEKKGGL